MLDFVPATIFTARWSDDVGQADWFIPRLHPFAQDAGSVIPDGFDAYCRIFHPAWRITDTGLEKLRWREVAAITGRIAHPTMQFESIRNPTEGRPDLSPHEVQDPREGAMPSDEVKLLAGILRKFTSTPDDCWFCIWEGKGELSGGSVILTHQSPGRPFGFDGTHIRIGDKAVSIPFLTDRLVGEQQRRANQQWRRKATNAPPDYRTAPRVEIPHRKYFLYHGNIDGAIVLDRDSTLPLMANMWWPEDRAWFVATEIDFAWTFVGGTRELIDRVLKDSRLEALPISLTDRVTIDADEVNRPPLTDPDLRR